MNAMSTDRCAFTCGAKPLNFAHGWIAPSMTCTASVRTRREDEHSREPVAQRVVGGQLEDEEADVSAELRVVVGKRHRGEREPERLPLRRHPQAVEEREDQTAPEDHPIQDRPDPAAQRLDEHLELLGRALGQADRNRLGRHAPRDAQVDVEQQRTSRPRTRRPVASCETMRVTKTDCWPRSPYHSQSIHTPASQLRNGSPTVKNTATIAAMQHERCAGARVRP